MFFSVDILLKETGLTPSTVIQRSGVSERTWFNFKHPDKKVSLNNIGKLARAFGVSSEQLELLKLFDRLVHFGGHHQNFHLTLRNFDSDLSKAIKERHKLFNKNRD